MLTLIRYLQSHYYSGGAAVTRLVRESISALINFLGTGKVSKHDLLCFGWTPASIDRHILCYSLYS